MTFDYFVELDRSSTSSSTDEFTTHYHHLVAKEKKKQADELRANWGKQNIKVSLENLFVSLWEEFAKPTCDLSLLPKGCWFLQFEFTLDKPYISKDDNPFYIIDNLIARDKVFRYPLVRSTAWKGALRHALWQSGYQEDDQQIQRLFGAANDDQPDEGNAGRLYFYPTLFTQTSLEIINPHDRKRRVGKNPILFESVPIGAKGTFSLLYVPIELIGRPEAEVKQQAAEDLRRVTEGLQAMFLTYGFGAKTSSGFGLAADGVENGRLALNMQGVEFPQARISKFQEPEEAFRKYLDETGRVKSAFAGSGEGGLLSNSEYKQSGEQSVGGSLSEFKRFRGWYGQFGEQWQADLQHSAILTDYPETPFVSLSQLVELCQTLQSDTANGGAA